MVGFGFSASFCFVLFLKRNQSITTRTRMISLIFQLFIYFFLDQIIYFIVILGVNTGILLTKQNRWKTEAINGDGNTAHNHDLKVRNPVVRSSCWCHFIALNRGNVVVGWETHQAPATPLAASFGAEGWASPWEPHGHTAKQLLPSMPTPPPERQPPQGRRTERMSVLL